MNQFQIPKGQNPLRLPFASFRLIFGLEKTSLLQFLLPATSHGRTGVFPLPRPEAG
jgi:hypothetical protein